MKSNPSYTELELATGLKNNEREAYELFYDEYAPAMYGVILRLVLTEHDSKAVLIEAFQQFRRIMTTCESENNSIFLVALNISTKLAKQFIETGRMIKAEGTDDL